MIRSMGKNRICRRASVCSNALFCFQVSKKRWLAAIAAKKRAAIVLAARIRLITSNPCYLLLQQKSGIDAPKAADCTNGKRVYTEAVDSWDNPVHALTSFIWWYSVYGYPPHDPTCRLQGWVIFNNASYRNGFPATCWHYIPIFQKMQH